MTRPKDNTNDRLEAKLKERIMSKFPHSEEISPLVKAYFSGVVPAMIVQAAKSSNPVPFDIDAARAKHAETLRQNPAFTEALIAVERSDNPELLILKSVAMAIATLASIPGGVTCAGLFFQITPDGVQTLHALATPNDWRQNHANG